MAVCVRGADFCVTRVICVIQVSDLWFSGDAGFEGCVTGDADLRHRVTRVTRGDAEIGRLRHPHPENGP
jgi:hypothetical protein